MIKEAVLYDPLVENRVKCNVCAHRCTIPEGKVGVCRTPKNNGVKLYTLIYNIVSKDAGRLHGRITSLPSGMSIHTTVRCLRKKQD